MITYEQTLIRLAEMKDEKYRLFNERIANIASGSSLGVRIPSLRAYAKEYLRQEEFSFDALFAFPNDVYEIRLLKCLCVGFARVSYAERVLLVRRCVPVIDGWAVCDLFCSSLKSLKKHREEYLPEIERYVEEGGEFTQRFAYVLLLGCYMEKEYLPDIFRLLDKADAHSYYTYMGAAWLLAEVLVRHYEAGVSYLKSGALCDRAKNKAIQKARESYRLNEDQKKYLKSLKKE